MLPRKADPPRVLLLADSRGRNLDVDLRDLLGNAFTLAYYPGATIMEALIKSEYLIKNKNWSQIYCMAGLCDVTEKNKTSRIVSMKNQNSSHLVSSYINTLHEAYSMIKQLSPHADTVKCIFCPVTGMNFSSYNRRLHHPDDISAQVVLNETIPLLNTEIVKFNNSINSLTPWTSRIIHRRHRRSYINYYEKLASDGCHLSPPVCRHWAESLHDAIVKNS